MTKSHRIVTDIFPVQTPTNTQVLQADKGVEDRDMAAEA